MTETLLDNSSVSDNVVDNNTQEVNMSENTTMTAEQIANAAADAERHRQRGLIDALVREQGVTLEMLREYAAPTKRRGRPILHLTKEVTMIEIGDDAWKAAGRGRPNPEDRREKFNIYHEYVTRVKATGGKDPLVAGYFTTEDLAALAEQESGADVQPTPIEALDEVVPSGDDAPVLADLTQVDDGTNVVDLTAASEPVPEGWSEAAALTTEPEVSEPEVSEAAQELAGLSKAVLRAMCDEQSIAYRQKDNKAALVALLS